MRPCLLTCLQKPSISWYACMVKDPRFLRVFGPAVGLHMIWNSPLLSEHFYFKAIPLGFVAWMAILGFIQDGLKQLRLAKQETAQPGAT